jgi:hypothetical protein
MRVKITGDVAAISDRATHIYRIYLKIIQIKFKEIKRFKGVYCEKSCNQDFPRQSWQALKEISAAKREASEITMAVETQRTIYCVKHDLLDDYLRQQLKSPRVQSSNASCVSPSKVMM